MPNKARQLRQGERFSEWKVLKPDKKVRGSQYYKVICSCGNVSVVRGADLLNGNSTRCKSCSVEALHIVNKQQQRDRFKAQAAAVKSSRSKSKAPPVRSNKKAKRYPPFCRHPELNWATADAAMRKRHIELIIHGWSIGYFDYQLAELFRLPVRYIRQVIDIGKQRGVKRVSDMRTVTHHD